MKRIALSLTVLLAAAGASLAQEKPYAEGQAPTIDSSSRAFPALTSIYVFTGVRSTSFTANTGVQTSVHCTNTASVTRQVRFLVRNFNGAIVDDNTLNILPFRTLTYSTDGTALYNEDIFGTLSATVGQGSMIIQATNPAIFCNAVVVDARSAYPNGVTLTGVRLNAAAGTME
jgi:hypothetical protein